MVLKVVVSLPSVLLYLSQWGSHQFSKSQGHPPKFRFLVSSMGGCVFGEGLLCGQWHARLGE